MPVTLTEIGITALIDINNNIIILFKSYGYLTVIDFNAEIGKRKRV